MWLKSIGKALLKIGKVVKIFGPGIAATYVAPFAPGAASIIALLVAEAVKIEGAFAAAFPGQQMGPKKLEALIIVTNQIISSSEAVAGKEIVNQELYEKAIRGFAQATVDLANSVKGEVETN